MKETEISTPSKLIPAVAHVTRAFHEADRLYGQLTSFFCRFELHPIPVDDHFAVSLQNFKDLKKSMNAEVSDLLSETIAQKTAPAFIKGYFIFYASCAIERARDAYSDLIQVARANRKLLNDEPSTWAIASTRRMITNSRFYARSWLQCVCDNRTYRPAKVKNLVELHTSWRPPRVCVMSPFGPLPYKEKFVWDRLNVRAGTVVQKFVADKYEENLLFHVERLAANAEFNELKVGDLVSVPPTGTLSVEASRRPSSVSNHLGHEARKKKTQATYRAWQAEHRKLKKKRPGMSVVWYARKIAASAVGRAKSSETVRKHLKR